MLGGKGDFNATGILLLTFVFLCILVLYLLGINTACSLIQFCQEVPELTFGCSCFTDA